jgi:alanyl-tRNA synthetase
VTQASYWHPLVAGRVANASGSVHPRSVHWGAMVKHPRSADDVRQSFIDFFVARGHTEVPSASLVPQDPTLLFNVAGMVPFKPYFLGDEKPPYKRAVSSQKCVRAGGKHNDLDDVGRTKRHLVFFEMLGNFSFGDYFKEFIIPASWELVTETWGLDGDRLWITVHETDDVAEQIWHDVVGVPLERIQRLGDSENFWQAGDTGPCGPCSEIHLDRGAAFGPDGGPAVDTQGDRFLEFWNLVFMQYDRDEAGTLTPLPNPSIDTGAGLERVLTVLQGVDSLWETDLMQPLIDKASELTGRVYRPGDYDDRDMFAVRVLAEHARSTAMLVADGVFPSNEARGYVLRRIIRRAVRYAYLLGTDKLVMPQLAEIAVDVMGNAYADVARQRDYILGVLGKEEENFRHTLRNGLAILERELADDTSEPEGRVLSGSTVFALHDTYGFPLELTQEIAAERGVAVDLAGFEEQMAEQRQRAKAARGVHREHANVDAYRRIVEQHGVTTFLGYVADNAVARVLDVLTVPDTDGDGELVEIFLDETPFYAESGGQVGDTGSISTETGTAKVVDTTFALPNLRRHTARIVAGTITPGQAAAAAIDVERRNSIRRNHTATHLVHKALRDVLGEHVKQAGSLVAPDRLRFDFSHYAPVTAEEITRIENLANRETLANTPVRAFETSKQEAEELGAIAFFGEKYGDVVRVLEAGSSVELCGGTHVSATGDIGAIKIVSEGSIGSNLRRIEAVTGTGAVALLQRDEHELGEIAQLVGAPGDATGGVRRKLDELRVISDENKQLRARLARSQASELAAGAVEGAVVHRVDGLQPNDLRQLAISVRNAPDVDVVVLAGETPTGGVSLAAAVTPGSPFEAASLIRDAAKAVGGGGGGKGDIATAGGKDPAGIEQALELAREAVALARGEHGDQGDAGDQGAATG